MPYFGVSIRNGLPLGLGSVIGFGAAPFSPADLFSAGEQGFWYDPSDFSTLSQDAAGTTAVTAVEQPVGAMRDKSGRNNTLTQATAGARPVVSARVNLLLATEVLATQNVTTLATTYTLRFGGTGSIALSGTGSGTYTAGTHSVVCTAGTLTLTVTGSVTTADLRAANDGIGLPVYQRVTTATDYDTQDFPVYLRFDAAGGAAAFLSSASAINFSGNDNMALWAGFRKLSDATEQDLAELNTVWTAGAGTFVCAVGNVSANTLFFGARGTAAATLNQGARTTSYAGAITLVAAATHSISGDLSTLLVNGSATGVTNGTADKGAGNFGNYTMFVGRRNGSTVPFTGRLYSFIGRNAATNVAQVAAATTWVNQQTRAFA